MDGARSWSVESKVFDVLIKEGDSGVRIHERSKKKKSSIFVRRDELAWLLGALEKVIEVETSEVFWNQSRAGFPRIITQKCSNRHNRFLTIEEFDGRRRSGIILIPEDRYGQGWARLIVELDRANSFLWKGRETREHKKANKVLTRRRYTEVKGPLIQSEEELIYKHEEPIAIDSTQLKEASVELGKAMIKGKRPVTYAQAVEGGVREKMSMQSLTHSKAASLEMAGCKQVRGIMEGETKEGAVKASVCSSQVKFPVKATSSKLKESTKGHERAVNLSAFNA